MSEFNFGLGNGKVTNTEAARIDRAIKASGKSATFVRYNDPARGPRYWFAAPNMGNPFDQRLAAAVMEKVGEVKVKQTA